MPVTSTDIVVYGSQVMPEDNVTLAIGGAIDLTTLIVFTDIDVPGTVEMVSSNAADTTQTLTITGRTAAGAVIFETLTLNGTTIVSFVNTYDTFMKFELSAAAAGTVTVRKSGAAGNLAIFPVGVTTIRQPFYGAQSNATGGATREYHEKIFIRNNNALLDLTEAQIIEQADAGNKVTFALDSALNSAGTNGGGNSRLVAPAGYVFNSSTKNVANSQNLSAMSAQGVWMKLTLLPGAAASKNLYTLRAIGVTT